MVREESTLNSLPKTPPVWAFFVLAALGLWLITAPACFQFHNKALVLSDIASGLGLILLSLCSRNRPRQSVLWLIASIGIWIQFAPLLFWESIPAAYFTNVLIGSLVITFCVVLFPLPGELSNEGPSIPPGWDYNPSSAPKRLPIAILVFFCWTISRYLAMYQLGFIDTVWDPFFHPGTKAVISSSVSKDFPVSDAGLGALCYTIEFFSVCQGGRARWRTAPWLVLVFGILVIPVGLTSVTLMILQPLVVGTWCTLCLVTAGCMLLAVPIAIGEVLASLAFLRKYGWKNLFKGGECPEASEEKESASLNAPVSALCKMGFQGMSVPWNLALSAFLGIFLMATPALFGVKGILFDLDPILGALSVSVSIIAFSDKARMVRLILPVFAVALIACALIEQEFLFLHLTIALFLGVLGLINRKALV